MPSLRIHEEVAYIFTKKYKEYDNRDFYLGVMAPDSPNIEGFAPKEERWEAHQRDKDLKKWEDKIIDFYKKNINNYNKYFLYGYIFHVLTDISFDKDFYYDLIKKVEKDNKDKNNYHNILVQDMNNYGSNFKYFRRLKDLMLKSNEYYDILNINKDLLKRWIIKNLKIQDIKEYKYISEEIVETLEEKVEKTLIHNNLLK